ncbi:MAG: hypothetical protein H0T73_16350 [Ardenticatenales bacterium]|nr:hypothetical protein [Ardenticatenales bacterium]
MFGTEKIPEIENNIGQLRKQIDGMTARIRGLIQHGNNHAGQFDEFFSRRLENSSTQLTDFLTNASPHRILGWSAPQWEQWQPPLWDPGSTEGDSIPTLIRIGELVESRQNSAKNFTLPALSPFIGQNRTILLKTRGNLYDSGVGLLQSLLIRTALMLPHQTAYTLLDPAGYGAAFPMRRHLPQVRENSGDARRDLETVIQNIQRINESYLDASTPSFEMVDPMLRINERYQFVFAADFPNKYDRRAIEALQSVANTGPRTGAYVFIHYNADHELPRDISIEELKTRRSLI